MISLQPKKVPFFSEFKSIAFKPAQKEWASAGMNQCTAVSSKCGTTQDIKILCITLSVLTKS